MKEKQAALDIKNLTLIALFVAVTCVLAPFSIPIGPVPISLTNLVIYFELYLLGWKKGVISYVVYLLIGLVGLPVFSGFTGGVGKLAGPTGGYLIGFIFMTIVCGIFIEKFHSFFLQLLGMILGTAVAYAFGTAWFCISTGTGVMAALALCVFPFIIGDLVKMVLAGLVAPKVAAQVKKIGA
ncbi:MAG: biotin transporter BioY [Eubacterium sp.]|nr:biotin transporter BioY [Eubacterium sp.]